MTDQDNHAEGVSLTALLKARFGEDLAVPPALEDDPILCEMAGHRTVRKYQDRPVEDALLRLVCACGLSAPSKSDLQQAVVVVVAEPGLRGEIAALIPSMPWIAQAGAFLVVCGNNRRQRAIAALHREPFPNDHLDPFFNAAVDAGLVLAQLLRAAGAVGLGCCPISVIRNHAARVSELLALPDHVFPVAGLCLGYPAEQRAISPRLDLGLTLHRDRYDESHWERDLEAYDSRREALHRTWGQEDYRWSRAKAKQYSTIQRADFGAFVRAKGFCLD